MTPGQRQAIIWTNAEVFLIGPLGTIFIEILIKIHIFSFKKYIYNVASEMAAVLCLGLNVLTRLHPRPTTWCRVYASSRNCVTINLNNDWVPVQNKGRMYLGMLILVDLQHTCKICVATRITTCVDMSNIDFFFYRLNTEWREMDMHGRYSAVKKALQQQCLTSQYPVRIGYHWKQYWNSVCFLVHRVRMFKLWNIVYKYHTVDWIMPFNFI